MLKSFISTLLGDSNKKNLGKLEPIVKKINDLEESTVKYSDKELKNKTTEFKERIEKGESLDSLLPEAFAVVRETAKRTLGQRHYDVQLIGGIILHQGKIAEMKTGEGKTLVATLAIVLNAMTGKGVHLVTVNDYLASRDATEMGVLYEFLGFSVGSVLEDSNDQEAKKAAYDKAFNARPEQKKDRAVHGQ